MYYCRTDIGNLTHGSRWSTSTGSQKITGWYIWNDEHLPRVDGKGQVLLQDYPMYHWVTWRNSPVMIRGMILQAGEIRIGQLLLLVTRNQVTNLLGKWCEILDLTRFIYKKKKKDIVYSSRVDTKGFEHSIDLSTCWGVLFLAGYLYWPILVGSFNPSD